MKQNTSRTGHTNFILLQLCVSCFLIYLDIVFPLDAHMLVFILCCLMISTFSFFSLTFGANRSIVTVVLVQNTCHFIKDHLVLHFSPNSTRKYKTVTLERGSSGLGFSIVGGFGSPHGDLPIYIKTIFNKVRQLPPGKLRGIQKSAWSTTQRDLKLSKPEKDEPAVKCFSFSLLAIQKAIIILYWCCISHRAPVDINALGFTRTDSSIDYWHKSTHKSSPLLSDSEIPQHQYRCNWCIPNETFINLSRLVVSPQHCDPLIWFCSLQGAAVEDGRLKRGDQIIAVNGHCLEGATHAEAVDILKRTKGTVVLTVLSWSLCHLQEVFGKCCGVAQCTMCLEFVV